jgi:hypothetical protein
VTVKHRVLLLICATGCAAQPPNPFFADAAYLRFGIDRHAEADALIRERNEQGEALALRLQGQHFIALSFMNRSGRTTRVRILTERGIALALDPDPDTALGQGARYALLAAPLPDSHDADGDGFEEVFVERRSPEATCLQVYRVRDVGFIDPVPVSVQLFGRELCPNGISDVDGDGRPELVIDAELVGFEAMPNSTTRNAHDTLEPEAPHVRIPMWARDHRYAVYANPAGLTRFATEERARRTAQLTQARHALDVPTAYRLAIEFAALSHVQRRSASEQVAAFDEALAGLVLEPPQQRAIDHARQHIFLDWKGSPSAAATRDSPDAG